MDGWAVPAAIGFTSGILSGLFGIGGGIVTTPAIRLILGAPEMIAVGTPLAVIIPSAFSAAVGYIRHGLADVRTGAVLGLSGALSSIVGALLSEKIGGEWILLGTAVLILYAAADMLQQIFSASHESKIPEPEYGSEPGVPIATTASIGVLAGMYSGLFGLGGGFVIVPMLSRWAGMPIKRAIGTSLVAMTLLAVPGTLTHSYAGNVDWPMALSMMVGVVPGALIGVRLTLGAADRVLRVAFALLLVAVASWLAVVELGWWL